jgi:hypothetical protein
MWYFYALYEIMSASMSHIPDVTSDIPHTAGDMVVG